MRPFRKLVGPVALGLSLAVAVPGPSLAAGTVLGMTFVPNNSSSCLGTPDIEIFQSTGGLPSPKAPATGVLTSWSFQAGTAATTLTLRVFRATATPGTYLVVADGGPLQNVAASSGLHTFPTRVPVNANDIIGLHATVGACFSNNVNDNGTISSRAGTLTAVGATAAYDTSPDGVFLDISAVLEPDADGDGYGDLSQDLCPSLASTHDQCGGTGPGTGPGTGSPPDTTITKKPKNLGAKTLKLKFTSTIAGSTFSCSLDKKKAKACLSPVKYVCLKPGKHTFSVFATSPQGQADPTPATTKLKVSTQQTGC